MEETSFGSDVPKLPLTPRTPRSLRLQVPPYNRGISLEPAVSRPRRSPDSGHSVSFAALPTPSPSLSPPIYKQNLCSPSIYLKFIQMALTIAVLVLVADGHPLVEHNTAARHFPFIVASAFTIVTGVILLGYALGMKMRELLMRIFGILGGILFLISGCLGANVALVYWADWEGRYNEGAAPPLVGPLEGVPSGVELPAYTDLEVYDDVEGAASEAEFVASIPRRRICFAAHAVLAMCASAAHFADVVVSYCRTFKLLN